MCNSNTYSSTLRAGVKLFAVVRYIRVIVCTASAQPQLAFPSLLFPSQSPQTSCEGNLPTHRLVRGIFASYPYCQKKTRLQSCDWLGVYSLPLKKFADWRAKKVAHLRVTRKGNNNRDLFKLHSRTDRLKILTQNS